MELFKIWLADLDIQSVKYIRKSRIAIENEHIDPSLIDNIPGEILSMQSLSKRLANLERELFIMKTLVGVAIVIASLIFAALKINWKTIFG
jgi:hypothetical protein